MSPHTNSFFSNTTGYTGEINLLDDLCREQIKMFGVDLLYMPRRMLNLDTLLHESTKNAFEIALPLPVYIKSFDGYDNGMEVLTKFGVRNSDELTLIISRSEFQTYYSPFLKSYYNSIAGRPETAKLNHLEGETDARPKEGDLLYFPFDDGIFEIKYVNFDVPFFQLGKGYVFEMQCEKFEYSGATFDTGYDIVDDTTEEPDYYRLQFNLEEETGEGTYIFHEKVTIYDYTDSDEVPEFTLYKDPGYVHRVSSVQATVEYWNKTEGILTVSDLSDLDPEFKNKITYDITDNKFDRVVIMGQSSSAVYYSEKAQTRAKAFDDEIVIQQEFDSIKVVDLGDESPFGFV